MDALHARKYGKFLIADVGWIAQKAVLCSPRETLDVPARMNVQATDLSLAAGRVVKA